MRPHLNLSRALKPLLLGVLLSSAASAFADSRLIGTWATEQSEGGMAGTVLFKKSGIVKLQPAGFPVVPGTWKVANGMLIMTAPNMGESAAGYFFAKKDAELTLHYPNGTKQVFKRVPGKTSGKLAQNPPAPAPGNER